MRCKYSKLLLITEKLNLVAGPGKGMIMFIFVRRGGLLIILMAGKKLSERFHDEKSDGSLTPNET